MDRDDRDTRPPVADAPAAAAAAAAPADAAVPAAARAGATGGTATDASCGRDARNDAAESPIAPGELAALDEHALAWLAASGC